MQQTHNIKASHEGELELQTGNFILYFQLTLLKNSAMKETFVNGMIAKEQGQKKRTKAAT